MAGHPLHAYLNDHLAGAASAVKLLDQLIDENGATDREELQALRRDVTEDRRTLEGIIERVGASRSALRQAGGVVAERVKDVKNVLDPRATGAFDRLQSLEILALGILGKRALWRALRAAPATRELLDHVDFPRLLQRADDQHARAEALRLQAAERAFATAQSEA